MPNWLKEEILRNKATIAKSSLEHPREETQSIEDEAVDGSLAKSDQADSKSIDSSRSTEEEDDDEVYLFLPLTCRYLKSALDEFYHYDFDILET